MERASVSGKCSNFFFFVFLQAVSYKYVYKSRIDLKRAYGLLITYLQYFEYMDPKNFIYTSKKSNLQSFKIYEELKNS